MTARLGRRAALRGGAAIIALPTLEAMAAPPAVRLVAFFLPNGFPLDNRFIPREAGRGYGVTPCLAPIARHLERCTVVSNVDGQGGPDSHAAGISAFATGLACTKTAGRGPSLDQVAARRLGSATKLPSLVVGVQKTAPYSSNGHSSDVFLNVSWQDAGQLAPAEREPSLLFARLFGGGAPQDDRAFEALRRQRRSVLDFVIGEAQRLRTRLGASDVARVDAHLTGVRELERRLPLDSAVPRCPAPAAPAKTVGHTARALQMADLLALALRCNLTNYGSYMYADGAGAGGPDDAIGLRGQQHEDAHAGNLESMQRFTIVQMQAVARFLDQLASVDEGGATLLDNAIVMIGTELGNGTKHTRENLPFVIAGKAGGRLHTSGTHVKPDRPVPLARMHLALLRLAGVDEATFGGQSVPMPELLA